MLIYVAELSHTGKGRSPNVTPLAAGYLSSYARAIHPDIEVEIYRDPNLLLSDAKRRRPDIVGFSVHAWSENLSSFCAREVKAMCKDTVIVAGGPSVDDIDSALAAFLKKYPCYDLCCPNEGEISLSNLIDYMKRNRSFERNEAIEGCAHLSPEGLLSRGVYKKPALSTIPSPYLDGTLDSFLIDGYIPIIQSMRGCPYSCTFCVSGNKNWSGIEGYDLEIVFEEIEYIKRKAKSNYLILTDENFGILKDRDVKLADYISNSYRKDGFPSHIYYYSAKVVTNYVLKIVETLNDIGEFTMSFQTLNNNVRKEIKRTNITWDRYLECLNWARERNVITSTEMIFGLPGETVESYLDAIELLIKSATQRIYSYNLRLFSGIDLAMEVNREKYKFETKYRSMERTYGVYANEVISETEEVVVGSRSFDFEDYKRTRLLGLFLEMISGRGYFTELLNLMISLDLPAERLLIYLLDFDYRKSPRLEVILTEYVMRLQKELFDTPDECEKYIERIVKENRQVPETKLNFIYTGKILLNAVIKTEFLDILKEFIQDCCDDDNKIKFFTGYIDDILSKQIVSFKNQEKVIYTEANVILGNTQQNMKKNLDDVISDKQVRYSLTLHRDSREFMRNNERIDLENEDMIQDIYMSISRFGLMREREVYRE